MSPIIVEISTFLSIFDKLRDYLTEMRKDDKLKASKRSRRQNNNCSPLFEGKFVVLCLMNTSHRPKTLKKTKVLTFLFF